MRRRRRLWAAAVLVVLGLMTAGVLRPRCAAWARGETDPFGHRRYVPPRAVADAAFQEVDLQRVHATLLPDWVIAASRRTRGVSPHGETEAWAALRSALAPDPNLLGLATELRQINVDDQLRARAGRVVYLSWAWSNYLDQRGAPYRLQAGIHRSRSRRGVFYSAMTYAVAADVSVDVGDIAVRTRLLSRLDHTNLKEQYLGATSGPDDGAIVVLDRLTEFALDEIWPLLAVENDPDLMAEARAFAPTIRAEARRVLDPEHLRVLAAAAPYRGQITQIVQDIHARKRCGSTLRINVVPWWGFEPERIERLTAIAQRDASSSCPAITDEELLVLDDASGNLMRAPGLQQAVAAMVSWLAQHVAIHEARHVADAIATGRHGGTPDCDGCPDFLTEAGRGELSAYLASIAWSPSPATALYQACVAVHDTPQGPHGRALAITLSWLGRPCGLGPAPDLTETARSLETRLLDRSDPIALPADFPVAAAVRRGGKPPSPLAR